MDNADPLPARALAPARASMRMPCVNDDVEQSSDRPTGALLVDLHRAGVAITVVCPPQHLHHAMLGHIASSFRHEDTVAKTLALYESLTARDASIM